MQEGLSIAITDAPVDPEIVLQEERAKLLQIELEMQAQTRARNNTPMEGETLQPYDRSRALALKAMYVEQSEVVTKAIQARPDRNAQRIGDA